MNQTDTQKIKQDDIRLRAENLMYYTEALIRQFDDWMPSEVANENMMREIQEREKAKRIQKFKDSKIQ